MYLETQHSDQYEKYFLIWLILIVNAAASKIKESVNTGLQWITTFIVSPRIVQKRCS